MQPTSTSHPTWAQVASRKGRTNHSFRPTIIQPVGNVNGNDNGEHATSATSQSLVDNASTSADSIHVIRPFLKGIEENSVLIDITDLSSWDLLFAALSNFNSDCLPDYEEYLGRLAPIRKYLQRSYMETMWMSGSSALSKILDGFYLLDGTFIKGFLSFSADAHIIKVRLERLPYLPTAILKLDMESRFSYFAEILDLGIYKTSAGCYMGQGYATLNLTPSTPREATFEPLQRVILL
ncbi:MAG: hypothetical protein EXX96DRAFT_477968 [Benjaminiella poitrasii]|nr:MAG: hypothetical protein EXX96DRAFT_477968 [Benjaminiella poitrasii]